MPKLKDKILADNRAKRKPFELILNGLFSAFFIAGFIFFLSIAITDSEDMTIVSILMSILLLNWSVATIEATLLSCFGHETISLEHECLVIRRKGCLFRHHKVIPLAIIRKIRYDEGRCGWYPRGLKFPEHLRVYYGNSLFQSTRFGLDIEYTEGGSVLGATIMNYVKQTQRKKQ